jgi:autotransporter-associated beta strand protein
MNLLKPTLTIATTVAALILTAQLAGATSYLWNVTPAGSNPWNTAGNWTPSGGPPGSADAAIFGQTGTSSSALTVNNVVSISTTVSILTYTNVGSSAYNVTQIPTGVTLTVSGSFTNGGLLGASSSISTLANMTGPGTFLVTGNNFRVGNNTSSGGTGSATLDLSTLSNFVYSANSGTFNLGNEGSRGVGNMNLAAASNSITAGTMNINVGATSTGTSGNFYLGAGTNVINAGTINIAAARNTTPVQFLGATGGLRVRGTGGTDTDRATMTIGNRNTGGTSTTTVGSFLANGHPVDMKLATLTLGTGNGNGSPIGASGVFQFDRGTVDVTTVNMAIYTGNAASTANGSLTVGANGLLTIGSGGVSLVNQVLGLCTGTLYIASGTVTSAGSIVKTTAAGSGNLAMNGGLLNLVAGNLGSPVMPIDNVTVTNFATLILTNTASMTPASVTALTLANSTLHLGVNPAAPFTNIVAGTVNASGTTTISIDQIPGLVAGGPAVTFALISYASGSDPFANLTLAPLTGGYTVLLVDDAANKRIDVTITPPSISTTPALWTGAANGNWDVTAINWSVSGVPANYLQSDPVQFDDSLLSNNVVNLTMPLVPPSITVTNNSTNYTFIGTGSLATSLLKQGSGTLTIDNSGGNAFSSVTISDNGVLQLGNNDANGSLGSATVTNNSSLVVNRSDTFTLGNAISGTGTLTKNGNGTLILSGANTYAGQTLLNTGVLAVNSSVAGGLTSVAGTTLLGSGTINGALDVSGLLNPGTLGGAGTLTAAGPVTLQPGATLSFDLNAANNAIGGGINDLLQDNGDLNLNNNTITLAFPGTPQTGAAYRLINFAGALNGSFNSTVIGTHYNATLDQATPNQINVTLSGSAANLTWNSTASGVWDVGATANWLNQGTSANDVFYQGDTVLFDDSVGGVQRAITLGVTASPGSVTVNSANNYSISGPGKITGAASLTKNGAGTLTLATTNDFTGTITIQDGTVLIANTNAIGSWTGGAVTVNNGGAFDIGGLSSAINQANPLFGARQFNIVGAGPTGNGAIVNSSTYNQQGAFQQIKLTGNATFGGPTRWDMRNNSPVLDLGGFKLTKTSPNQISLVNIAVTSGDIDINQGALSFETSSSVPAGGTITVNPGGYLGHYRLGSGAMLRNVVLNGGGITNFATSGTTGTNDAPVTLTANSVLGGSTAAACSLVLNGIISESGGSFGVTKASAGPIVLTAASTYSGNTVISAGTLSLAGSASIANSPNITVTQGGMFDVSGVTGGFTLAAGQTLGGGGTNNGNITVANSPTAIVHPGGGGAVTTTLLFSNSLTFSGSGSANVVLDLSSAYNGHNDQIVLGGASSTLTGNGTIITINSAGTLDTTHDYVLFNLTGASASIAANSFSSTPAWAGTTPKYATGYSIVVSGKQVLLRYTPIALTVTAVTDSKTYDGSTNSAATPAITSGALATGDTPNFTQAFDTRNAGVGKTLIPSGVVSDGNGGHNYNVTFVPVGLGLINPRPLTVTAVTDTKPYDGTASSSVLPTFSPGLVDGDTPGFWQAFDNRNAGTAKTLTPAGAVNDGNGGNNYAVSTIPVSTGVITAKPITVTATTNTKTYDGGTSALAAPTLTSGSLVTGDTLGFTETYDTKDVGTDKTLTPAGGVSDGNSGHNYSVTFENNTTGVITPKAITVTGITANNKAYDGTNTATLNTSAALLVGVESGDAVTLVTSGYSATFATSSAGTNIAVTVTNLTLGSANASDYTLMQPTGLTANIATATPTAPQITGQQMARDGFQLTFTGPSGQTYKVLASEDLTLPLASWTVLTTGTFGSDPVTFTDTDSPGTKRFYSVGSP